MPRIWGKKFFSLGEASNSGNEIEGSPWALCNQLAHCAGAVTVEMGPQLSGVLLFIISVKEMHIGLGINSESFKCLLSRTTFGELFPQLPSLGNADSLRLPLLIENLRQGSWNR
jgi:hypothetical protein